MPIDSELAIRIVEEINRCYNELTAHPNLDLYATITKICSFEKTERQGLPAGLLFGDPLAIQAPVPQETNPYIFEIDPCSKCYD